MRTHYLGTIILLFNIFVISCKTENPKNKTTKIEEVKTLKLESEISDVWSNFIENINSKNKSKFKENSNKLIQCHLCTDSEVEIDSFLKNNFDTIFNTELTKVLTKKTPVFSKNGMFYEVLVTTTQPTFNHQGGQHRFQFKKNNKKWMFNLISTIP